MWFKSHAFKKTRTEKTPWRRKAFWKMKKGVATTVGERATTKKNSTDWADGLFTRTSVKQHTPKATLKKSSRIWTSGAEMRWFVQSKINEGLTHICTTMHELSQHDSLTVEFNEQNFPQGKEQCDNSCFVDKRGLKPLDDVFRWKTTLRGSFAVTDWRVDILENEKVSKNVLRFLSVVESKDTTE